MSKGQYVRQATTIQTMEKKTVVSKAQPPHVRGSPAHYQALYKAL